MCANLTASEYHICEILYKYTRCFSKWRLIRG